MLWEVEDRGDTLFFPGVRWGSLQEFKVHKRQRGEDKLDLVAIKVPGHTAYGGRTRGTVYASAEIIVWRLTPPTGDRPYLRAQEIIRVPISPPPSVEIEQDYPQAQAPKPNA